MDLWRRYEDQLPGGAGEGQRILPHPYAGSEGECIRFYLYGLQKPGAIILDQPGTVRPSYEKWEYVCRAYEIQKPGILQGTQLFLLSDGGEKIPAGDSARAGYDRCIGHLPNWIFNGRRKRSLCKPVE